MNKYNRSLGTRTPVPYKYATRKQFDVFRDVTKDDLSRLKEAVASLRAGLIEVKEEVQEFRRLLTE